MKKRRKTKTKISLEVEMLAIILGALFLAFFALNVMEFASMNENPLQKAFDDGVLTEEEIAEISELSCEEIKKYFNTDKRVCMYFRDDKGDLMKLTEDGKYGIGCPGLMLEGIRVCG